MKRFAELDGLRAIAILAVVAWHYLGAGDGPSSATWRAFIVGRAGVDLFFVLSGYLITTILLNSKDSPRYFSAFYGRRSFRILPIYFLMVGVYLVGRQLGGSTAGYLFGGPLPWWSYLVGLQNFFMATSQSYGANWLGGTWSLAVEEQFYLVFPLVVYFAPPALLPRLLVALLVLCPIGRTVAVTVFGDDTGYYVLMPLRADVLAVGALIAWLEVTGSLSVSVRKAFRVVFWSTVVFFPAYAWMIKNSDFNNAVWGHSYLAALFGSVLFMVIENRGAPGLAFLRSRPAAFFARISYALYLAHGVVLVLVFAAAGSPRTFQTWQGAGLTACAFVISIVICVASYRLIEAPLIKYAHRKYQSDAPSKLRPAVAVAPVA